MTPSPLRPDLGAPLLRLSLVGVQRLLPAAPMDEPHAVCPYNRLLGMVHGEGTVSVDRRVWPLPAGYLLLVPKFAMHSVQLPAGCECVDIRFADDAAGSQGVPSPEGLLRSVPSTALDRLAVRRLVALGSAARTDPAARLEALGIVQLLFAHFVTDSSLAPAPQPRRFGGLQPVVEHILAHLDEPLTVAGLAAQMCMHPDHFTRVFRRLVGTPPSDFVRVRRMERAQALLATTSLTVAQVAAAVGVSSASLFSQQFLRVVGCTPRAYRQRCLRGEAAGH